MLPFYLGLSCGVAVCAVYASGGAVPGLLALILAAAALRWLAPEGTLTRVKAAPAKTDAEGSSVAAADSTKRLTLHGAFNPPGEHGLVDMGRGEPKTVENENCVSKTVILFSTPDKSGPFEAHFAGKKRLWEIRWQIRVKRTPKRPLVFGVELAEYVPLSEWMRRIQQMTVKMLRRAVGSDLYHSAGESPQKVRGEAERPVFVMPLWAFDQLIISEPGKEPDILNLAGLGKLRTDGRADFIKTMNSLQMQPDKVYTFSFWCISRFVDVLDWNLLGIVPGGIDFNVFCGRPPVNVVIYELEDAEDTRETRHLQSRKKYYYNFALWSTKAPPSRPQIQAMLQDGQVAESVVDDTDGHQSWCCCGR